MATPLLITKLHIPEPRPNLVPRPHLLARLDEGVELGRKLTLVSAPAGFGKTTLIAEWLHRDRTACVPKRTEAANRSARCVAWLSLDEGDNDLSRFLTYFVSALQTTSAVVGISVLRVLQSGQLPPIELLLTPLINEIASLPSAAGTGKVLDATRGHTGDRSSHDDEPADAAGCREGCPYILVLDDYHLVRARPVQEAVSFILSQLPPNMHLVIATRRDPALPLVRLRAGGQMTEVRARGLRFSVQETAAFLNQMMDLQLTPDQVATLEARTEGWIAGLHLAALSLQHEPDRASFINAFAGDDGYVVDYLVNEVVHRQSEQVQDFLLRTAILDRLSDSLCASLIDSEGDSGKSQDILEQLERANLFLVPLDNRRQWYRYHHLFGSLMRHRLRRQLSPAEISRLHLRASRWYEANGFTEEAIGHALAAEDFERSAQLIEPIGFDLLTTSRWEPLSAWLRAIPAAFRQTRPWLCIYQAWMSRRAGRLDEVTELVELADRAMSTSYTPLSTDDQRALRANLAALRGYLALSSGSMHQAIENAREARDLFPPDDPIRCATGLVLGLAFRKIGDLSEALRSFAQARSMAEADKNSFATQIATWDMAYVRVLQGRLHLAVSTYCEALYHPSLHEDDRQRYAGQPYVYIGDILREWNELDAAASYLMQGIELCEPSRLLDAQTDATVSMARVRLAQGDIRAALESLREAEQALQVPKPDPVNRMRVDDLRVRLWLAQDRLAEASHWAENSGLSVDDDLLFWREMEHITLARVLLALGLAQTNGTDLPEALALLDRLLEAAQTAGWMGKVIEIQVMRAMALQALDFPARAIGALAQALSLAEPEGYVRVFLDEGPMLERLLLRAVEEDINKDYAALLLAQQDASTEDGSQRTSVSPVPFGPRSSYLLDPLTTRELEVLALIADGLSNRQISENLFLALGTVKVHTRNIYSKLDVHSRTQAVARAHQLGLL